MCYSITGMEFCHWVANCYETFGRTLAIKLLDPLITSSPGQLHSEIRGQTSCYQWFYGGTPTIVVWLSSEAELLRVTCREIPFALALRSTGTQSSIT